MAKEIKMSVSERNKLMYIVYTNIYKMISYRGYVPETQLHDNEAALNKALQKQDPMVITGKSTTETGKDIKVFLVQNKDTLSKQKLPGIISQWSKPNDDIIVVYEKKMKSAYNVALKAAEELRAKGANKIWYMTFVHLIFEVPRHVYISASFRILSKEEIAAVTKLNRIPPEDFPRMKEYDPLVLWYGAVAGNVLESVSMSESAGFATKYYSIIPQSRY